MNSRAKGDEQTPFDENDSPDEPKNLYVSLTFLVPYCVLGGGFQLLSLLQFPTHLATS